MDARGGQTATQLHRVHTGNAEHGVDTEIVERQNQ